MHAKKLFLAEKLIRKGKLKKALELYNEIIEDDSKCIQAYQGAANVLAALDHYEDAIVMCNRAIEINQNLIIPHTILAIIYNKLGEVEKSREEINIALTIDPNSADALCCYGTILLANNRIDESLEYLERAASRNPSLYKAQLNLAVAYGRKKDSKKVFRQSFTIFFLRPTIKNFLEIILLTTRFYRHIYLLVLLVSGLFALFYGAKIVLVVSSLIMLIYFATGVYIAFVNKQKQWKQMGRNLFLGFAFGLLGGLIYLVIFLIRQALG
jgi:tetratricopeptide (TPR) repeat protein